MDFEAGEHVLLGNGNRGWTLTNKRLLRLKNDSVQEEIPLSSIAEAYPYTEVFTNLTKLRIRTHGGDDRSIALFTKGGLGILLGGDDYICQDARSTVERYAFAINRAVDSLQAHERTFSEPEPPCLGSNEPDLEVGQARDKVAKTENWDCPNCGRVNSPRAKICTRCGTERIQNAQGRSAEVF